MVFCNVIVPQIFWFKRARTSVPIMLVASVLINIGMWFERFVIIVTSSVSRLPAVFLGHVSSDSD